MGYTICYDTLIEKAKKSNFRSNTEPGQEDVELNKAIDAEKHKYDEEAESIYENELNKLESNYKSEKSKIDVIAPSKEEEYKNDRFNSTDAAKYGDNNIKTSFSKEMNKLMQSDEYQNELLKASDEEKIKEQNNEKNEKDKDADKQINNAKIKHNEKNDSSNINDLVAYASKVGKDTDKQLDELQELYNASLRSYKETVYGHAKEKGEKEGETMVQKYNEEIQKLAKQTYNNNMKNIIKAQIDKDIAIQNAKLKLGALIGL